MRWLSAFAIVLFGAVSAPTAFAAPPSEADALVVRGVEHYKRQSYEEARVAFSRAYGLGPKTALLFNLALAEVQSGHAVDAVNHFRAYLHAPDGELDKAEIIRTKWLPRAESECGRLRIEAASGAAILVDAEAVGVGPMYEAVPVSPGEHRVEERRPGVAPLAVVVRAETGAVTPVSFTELEARASAGSSPAPDTRMHRAASAPSGGAPPAEIATVATVGGAAVLSGGIAVLFAISSSDDASHASDLRGQLASSSACAASPQSALCSQLRTALDDQRSHRDLAYGFGIGAGVLLAADAVLVLLWPRTPPPIVAAPATNGRGATFGLRAQF